MTSPLLEPSNEQGVLSPSRGVLAGEVAKALCVSAVALFVDVVMLLVLVEAFGAPHLLSASLAFGLGLLVNYSLSVAWVFRTRRVRSKRREFIIFSAVGLIGMLLNAAIIYAFTRTFASFDYRVAKAVAVAAIFSWNFGARKAMLF